MIDGPANPHFAVAISATRRDPCWVNDTLADEGPLDGFKIVELSMYVQAPVAGLALASLGADVIKIEQVGNPDYMRAPNPAFGVAFDERGQHWMYSSVNRNKRSLALDIVSEGGRPVFEQLIREADAFITNIRDAGLKRYGADSDTLLGINPALVYCRGGGFGLQGLLADDPCQDTVGMAYAGFMDSISSSDVPTYPPGSMSDILTGSNMASAVMAGLLKRVKTGRGCVVGTSQTQALMWLQLQAVGCAVNLGEQFERFDHTTSANPLFTLYETADGWLAIAAIADSQWPPIARAVGLEYLLGDARFETLASLRENREEFRPIFAEVLEQNTTAHWWGVLRESGAWVAPVNRLGDLGKDQNILDNEYLVTFDDGLVAPPTPFDVDGFRGVRGRAAAYGEHTDEILSALGYSIGDIAELKNTGAAQ